MGNRKQPFGYKMEFGEIVPQPQEAETVRSIYLQYLAGVSFKQLAEQLQTEDVPYDEDKSWNKNMVARILEDDRYTLRPANYTSRVPGRGWGVYDGPGGVRIGVMNLIGRCEMDSNFDNPFTTADRVLRRMEGTDVVLVDFHAEATSEKGAMGYYLDGRAQAVWGTHTHVPTADGQILPKGLGFVTDLGMTGPAESVLGIRPEQAVNRFLGGLPRRFEPAPGPCKLESVLFSIDTDQRRCVSVERVDIRA